MSSDESELLNGENPVIHGSVTIEGNLDVQTQTTTNGLTVVSDGD